MEEQKVIEPIKKPVGRPKDSNATISKTYRFFENDIEEMLNWGATPKEIFRLGCLAKKNNPQMLVRIKILEEGNTKLQDRLTKTFQRASELEREVQELKNKLIQRE